MSSGEMCESDEVRATYDTVAESYAELIPGLSAETTLDVAMLDTFAAQVLADGGGPVIDVGSGPGRITAYLHSLGVEASGIDLSPGMVAVAQRAHPELQFAVGSLDHLAVADASLSGLLAWYSIIHTPPAELPAVFSEFRRVVRPDGYVLLGIHVGSGTVRVTRSYGHDVGVELSLFSPEEIAALLVDHGFVVLATVVREPEGHERRPQAFLLAQSHSA